MLAPMRAETASSVTRLMVFRSIPRAISAVLAAAAAIPVATAHADSYFPRGLWSWPLPATTPPPESGAVVAHLADKAAGSAGFSLRQWDARIYRVPAKQAKVKVVVDG